MNDIHRISTQCCITGGGPAGLLLGYLLARAGVNVVVLEKHKDFLRDFRGDTVHPSTLEVIDQLGLIDGLLGLPHQKMFEVSGVFGAETVKIADFRALPTKNKFIALMPQWDFLNFLAQQASIYPNFALRMSNKVSNFTTEAEKVTGVQVETDSGRLDVVADLIIAADGRHSTLRTQSDLPIRDVGAPMDVLWFKLNKPTTSEPQPLGRFSGGRILILLDRSTYWQCGYIIPKNSFAKLRAEGFESFRRCVTNFVPNLEAPLEQLSGWDDTSLLTVQVNRLKKWFRPGLLCIGDAAHAMSPVGGIGINLAIQDAVAAANILAVPLRSGSLHDNHLQTIQARRNWPTRMTQRIQVMIQNQLIAEALDSQQVTRPPPFLRLMTGLPLLNQLPGRFIGLGLRRENVGTHLLG